MQSIGLALMRTSYVEISSEQVLYFYYNSVLLFLLKRIRKEGLEVGPDCDWLAVSVRWAQTVIG